MRADVFGYVESVIKNHLIYNDIDGSGGYPSPFSGNSDFTQSDLPLKGTNEEETHPQQRFRGRRRG